MEEEIREVESVQFRILSPDEIRRMSVCEVIFHDLHNYHEKYKKGGLMDLRMGPIDKKLRCETCAKDINDCPGHFGHIELAVPLFHVGFVENVVQIAKCVCFWCGRIMIDKKSHKYKKIRNINNPQHRLLELMKICKPKTQCDFYYGPNDPQNGCMGLRPNIKYLDKLVFQAEFSEVIPSLGTDRIPMKAKEFYQILRRIDPEDYFILGCDKDKSRPEWKITTCIPVPPPCVRPNNMSNMGAKGEDDLTKKLSEIIKYNTHAHKFIKNGDPKNNLPACIEILQLHYATYLDNSTVSVPQTNQRGGKPTKGVINRWEKKSGRVRGNLMGKRSDYTGRTVITPEPELDIDELGVPESIAKILTFPETVNHLNIEDLRQRVRNGPDNRDGANYIAIIDPITKKKNYVNLRKVSKPLNVIASELEYSMQVGRHMKDGDIVILNRQPSLHKFSMMAHKVKIFKENTFKLNLSVTTPYNADFDGDEMNIHLPQTLEAQVHIWEVMGVSKCLTTPQNNGPTMGLVQDALLLCRMLTDRDSFLTKDVLFQLICKMSHFDGKIPKPAILKPQPLWTGKQLFSMILPKMNHKGTSSHHPDYEDTSDSSAIKYILKSWSDKFGFEITKEANIDELVKKNTENKKWIKFLKLCRKKFNRNVTMDNLLKCSTMEEFQKKHFHFDSLLSPSDSRVIIENGELLSGYMCKKTIGKSNNSLIHIIRLDYGPDRTKRFMQDAQRIANEYSNYRSCSVGMKDMPYQEGTMTKNKKIIEKAAEYMRNLRKSKINENEFEQLSNKMLNNARNKICEDTFSSLSYKNAYYLMVTAGSKGQKINAAQIVRCVGQQNVEGQRIPNSFNGRTLSCFQKGDTSPEAKGFIISPYFVGLTPQEAFFHAMAGREGLIDTAVKTSEIGYIQRRLCKSMEDIVVCYDGTARNGLGEVVQFVAGEDNLDASKLEFFYVKKLKPNDFKHHFVWNDQVYETDATGVLLHELSLLVEDYKYISKTGPHYLPNQRLTIPFNISRILQNLSTKKFDESSPLMDPIRSAFELIEFQKKIWNLFPAATEKWNNHIGLVIRWELCSKKTVQEHKLTVAQWNYILNQIYDKVKFSFVSPGECVGIIAGQSIGEPATQMSVAKDTQVVIIRGSNVFVGPVSEFIDQYLIKEEVMTSQVADLTEECYIASVTPNEKLIWSKISQVSRHPASGGMVKVTTKTGRSICCTLSHSFLKRGKDQTVQPILGSELKVGDRIPVIKNLPNDLKKQQSLNFYGGQIDYDEDFGYFIGSFIAGGELKSDDAISIKTTIFTFDKTVKKATDNGYDRYVDYINKDIVVTIQSRFLSEILKQYVGVSIKQIPSFTFNAPNQFVKALLRGYFDTVALVDVTQCSITIKDINRDLLDQISLLLNTFGMFSLITKNETLMIQGSDYISMFLEQIGSNIPSKRLEMIEITKKSYSKDNFDKIPQLGEIVRNLADRLGLDYIRHQKWHKSEAIERKRIKQYIRKFREESKFQNTNISKELSLLIQAVESDVIWDKIVSLEFIDDPKEYVYDFTVPGSQTFAVQNGILVHNTLNTFHLAGVSEKNVTLGVPRLKEIVNATKKMKTPSLTVRLKPEIAKDKLAAESIMKRLECIYLRDLVVGEEVLLEQDKTKSHYPKDQEIVDLFQMLPDNPYDDSVEYSSFVIRLKLNAEKMILYELSMEQVADRITEVYGSLLHIQYNSIYSKETVLRIRPIVDKNILLEEDKLYAEELIPYLKKDIKISGIDRIKRTFLQQEAETMEYYIETEGVNLLEVMAVPGVDGKRTYTNDINEAISAFGVEGGRRTIVEEGNRVMSFDNGYVGVRHLFMMADVMTHYGSLMPFTRHGVNRRQTGPLSKCSFEETGDILMEAGLYFEKDGLRGVTEGIIMGKIPKIGTHVCDVFLNTKTSQNAIVYPPKLEMNLKKEETETQKDEKFIFSTNDFIYPPTFVPKSPEREPNNNFQSNPLYFIPQTP